MRRGRWMIVSLLLLTSLIFAGCQEVETTAEQTEEETEEETSVIRLVVAAAGSWEGVYRGDIFEEYAAWLEEASDGRLVLEMYDNGALGNDLDLIAGVQLGTVTIVNSVPTYQASAVPEAALLDTPGVFEGIEEYNALMEGSYWDVMQGYYNEQGLQLLSSYAYTTRNMTSNIAPESVSDWQLLRMRVMESSYAQIFWETMGTEAYPLQFTEVYLALSQGIIDAQENALYVVLANALYEVQDYIIMTEHTPMVSSYVMNKEMYDALTEEDRALLEECFAMMAEETLAAAPSDEADFLEQLQTEYGMQVVEVTDEMKEQMQVASLATLTALRQDLGDEVVDEFLAAVEAVQAE